MEENILIPGDYLTILNRRKWALIVPFILIAAAAALTAILLPSIYKSNATILIQQRAIPTEYVTSSMSTFAEHRIQSIKQRLLASQHLQKLIREFDLYQKEQKKKTINEITTMMRKKISLAPINVEVANNESGQAGTATIAFSLSFEGKNPYKVQSVAHTLTTLFLTEDLKVRTEQASSTHEFLKNEKDRVKETLTRYEKELTAFKKKYANALPEVFQMNMMVLVDVERNIEKAKENLRALKEKRGEMDDQLANTPIYLKSEIEKLKQKTGDELRLGSLKMELINLKTKFSDLYPDVKKLKQEIDELSKKVALTKANFENKKEDKNKADKNPAYITLSSRLAGIRSDIGSINNQIDDLEKQAADYRERLAASPGVEEKYNAILSERNSLNTKYNEMQGKILEAKIAQTLEFEQKSERFTLVESASFPEKPFKPNRMAIAFIGIVLGLVAGVGLASLIEFSDTSFRDADALYRATGFPVLTIIPNIKTIEDRKKRTTFRVIGLVTAVITMIVLVVLFHNYVK